MTNVAFKHDPPPPEHGALTLQAWAELPEDTRGELVDGRLVEEEMPSLVHEHVVSRLVRVLGNWGEDHDARIYGSGLKLAVSATHGRMPDLNVYLRQSPRPQLRGLIDVPPSIAIEVVTPTPRDQRRDRVEKLREYAVFGVRWYWILDPAARTLELLELGEDGRYVHALDVSEGVLTSVPGCEGLTLDLDGLWASLDGLEAE